MKVFYDRQDMKLVYLGESASPDFWDSHWEKGDLRKSVEKQRDNKFILGILRKYFPDKKGRILEGGCGRGQIVYCMHVHGYKSVGIDFAKKTIKRTKEIFPELNVRVGDVRALQFPENYFAGYWSEGVIEHFWKGYDDILREAKRVLVSGGYAFFTFPYMSPLRKLKVKLGLYEEFSGGEPDNFYQFVLDHDLVIRDFEASGFKLIKKRARSGLKGLKDEVSIFKPFLQKLYDYQGESLWILGFRYLLDRLLAVFAGHMIFLVLRNKNQ